jgi:hypothetical protein
MRTKSGRTAALLVLAALGLSAWPASLSAASPEPAASALPSDSEGGGERPELLVYLDRPLPIDVAPGDELDVGATIWDATAGQISPTGATIFLRAVPPEGSSEVSSATAISDWPGHYRGTVTVPPAGLGRLEMGITGTVCENDICSPSDWVFEIAGAGPPPGASITGLAEARIDYGGAALPAGQPADLEVKLEPNAEWEELTGPPELVVRAREALGPNLAAATLPLVDAAGLVYAGSISIPVAGDLILEAATDEDGGDATRFGTSMTRVSVAAGSGADVTDPGDRAPPADEGLPTVVVVLLALVAVVGAGVVLAGFRDGAR